MLLQEYFSALLIVFLLVPIPILFIKASRYRQTWPGIPCVQVPSARLKHFLFVIFTVCAVAVAWIWILLLGVRFLNISWPVHASLSILSLVYGLLWYHLHSTKKISQTAKLWICKTQLDSFEILQNPQVHQLNLQPGSVEVIKTFRGPGGITAFDYVIKTENIRFCIAIPWDYYMGIDIKYTGVAKISEGLLVKGGNREVRELHRYLQAFVKA
jgi:hypothetical protein